MGASSRIRTVDQLMLRGDNETSIGLAKSAKSQHRTRHIHAQHQYVRELVQKKNCALSQPRAPTCSQADGVIKA